MERSDIPVDSSRISLRLNPGYDDVRYSVRCPAIIPSVSERASGGMLNSGMPRCGALPCFGEQCGNRHRIRAVFLPHRVGGVLGKIMRAPALANTERTSAPQVAYHFGLDLRVVGGVQLELFKPLP